MPFPIEKLPEQLQQLQQELHQAINVVSTPGTKNIQLGDNCVQISTPFPSPADWRDQLIYFLLIDRFNNPITPPKSQWNQPYNQFQGGTFNGIREQLEYLQKLGVGAIWLSPVLKNCQYNPYTYHGYGIQDFLKIDPRFASTPGQEEQELRALIDEAHARGIYIIFDIVLNHVGDVFEYDNNGCVAPWQNHPYPIHWRDEHGQPKWSDLPDDSNLHPDAGVWPIALQHNEFFRRQGKGGEAGGDFESLKELVTGFKQDDYYPVQEILILAYQYIIAKFDIDGFRIDTLKYIEPEFARIFGNAMREFALSIGKKNFFTFGEIWDSEAKIASFIGKYALEQGDLIGVDAALDFPLFYKLTGVAKGFLKPAELVEMFEERKQVQKGMISSHSEASKYFVTFLDNHDIYNRFCCYQPNNSHQYDNQVILALGCLFSLQGIPCVYYGTEQGLDGAGDKPEAVREALWGKENAFDRQHPFYQAIQKLIKVRNQEPALRYGRQYFRGISGDGINFGISYFPQGVLAFSRILNDREVVVIANTNTQNQWQGYVLVDFTLNSVNSTYHVLFSNQFETGNQTSVIQKGSIRMLPVKLQPMEIKILAK